MNAVPSPSLTHSEMRAHLLSRRESLQELREKTGGQPEILRLLSEVDAAIERMNDGTYGICEECHEPIEEERLLADPLLRFCLPHLTPEQQQELEDDVELASRIQATLLPKKSKQIDGWEMYYHYEPAGPLGGDYCDVIHTGDSENVLWFVLADVSGKGLAASLLVTHLHAIFHSLIPFGFRPDELVARANRQLCESNLGSLYVTLVCGKATATGEIEICNAGHLPPLYLHQGNSRRIDATGVPVGLFRESRYTVTRFSARKGDSLVLFTDGLCEAMAQKVEYGLDRAERLARKHADIAPQALISALTADLASFLAGSPRQDDLTLLALRRS
jgi:phosphoserine phosphatase RsbU/P